MVVRGESAEREVIRAVTVGNTVRVTAKVHHTLNNMVQILLMMLHPDTVGAIRDWDN